MKAFYLLCNKLFKNCNKSLSHNENRSINVLHPIFMQTAHGDKGKDSEQVSENVFDAGTSNTCGLKPILKSTNVEVS